MDAVWPVVARTYAHAHTEQMVTPYQQLPREHESHRSQTPELFPSFSQLLSACLWRNSTTTPLIWTRTSLKHGQSQVCRVRRDTFVTHHFISSACNLVQVQNSWHGFPTQERSGVMLCVSVRWAALKPSERSRRREGALVGSEGCRVRQLEQ